MPVHRITPPRAANHEQLVDELVAEWQGAHTGSSEPAILEEANAHGDVERVYVVWSAWEDMDRTLRGEVIMDAAQRVKSPAQVNQIIIAMGLSPKEADRLGMKWR